MDTKLKSYSHLITTKIIAYILTIVCFTGVFYSLLDLVAADVDSYSMVFQDSYFSSKQFMKENNYVLSRLTRLAIELKSEEAVLNGESITPARLEGEEESLFWEYRNSAKYDYRLSHEENFEAFKSQNQEKILQIRDKLITENLKDFKRTSEEIDSIKGLIYYVSDGTREYTNSANVDIKNIKTYPAYLIYDGYNRTFYPREFNQNNYFSWINGYTNRLMQDNNIVYIAFTDEFLTPRKSKWQESKLIAKNSLIKLTGFSLAFILLFIYLGLTIGRKSFEDDVVHLNLLDRLYNDIKLALCIMLIVIWFGIAQSISFNEVHRVMVPVTAIISALGLPLVLSFIKHFKNKTIFKHTLIYRFFYSIFSFVGDVYSNGSTAVKLVLLVIGYPLLIAITFFIFPLTIAAAAWLTLKKIREYNAIKEGVEKIKNGDLHHTININSNGEFGKLASNINKIADGLKEAVDSELKSERLKTELITNVSHDIRTPLTSIITYIDLIKMEEDSEKIKEYVEILEQKSQRLKLLTDDLFEAAKATSGNIPVNLEKIDIASLITQGLGELNDKIEDMNLEFKINQPQERLYIAADGKLFWRALENLFSNILKYAQRGSRVYISILELENEVSLVIKNISAYELNISADELMERFARGEESRSSQGSGLGLSIAKSLIDIQRGQFKIEVDGDLFKAIVHIPKYRENH